MAASSSTRDGSSTRTSCSPAKKVVMRMLVSGCGRRPDADQTCSRSPSSSVQSSGELLPRVHNYEGLLNAAHSCVAYGKIGGTSGFIITQAAPVGLYTSTTGTSFGSVSATLPAHGVAAWSQSLGLWVIAGDSGAISTSPTGLAGTWTARTTPAGWVAGCGGAKRIVYNGAVFVVLPLGSYNKCLTSPDGATWTERSLGFTATWTGLAYSAYDGIWMAGASNLS